MVLAGMEHGDMDEAIEKYEEYCDEQYDKLKLYFKNHIGESSYETFVMFMDLMPNMKGTMLELWLRAKSTMNEDLSNLMIES